jgi:hypothetical protein
MIDPAFERRMDLCLVLDDRKLQMQTPRSMPRTSTHQKVQKIGRGARLNGYHDAGVHTQPLKLSTLVGAKSFATQCLSVRKGAPEIEFGPRRDHSEGVFPLRSLPRPSGYPHGFSGFVPNGPLAAVIIRQKEIQGEDVSGGPCPKDRSRTMCKCKDFKLGTKKVMSSAGSHIPSE